MASQNSKPRIWLTRPEALLGDMLVQLQACGVDIHCDPLLAIKALDNSAQRQHLAQQLARIDTVDISIFISANAVEYFARQSNAAVRSSLSRHQVFAVGRATVSALAEIGISAQCPAQIMSSEGLLLLPELADVGGRSIFIFRGVGGRGFLQAQLQQRGAMVEHVELYCRYAPALSPQTLALLEASSIDAIMIGSAEGFDNLMQQIPTLDREVVLIVPSERVSAVVSAAGFAHYVVANSAGNADMVAAMTQYFKKMIKPQRVPARDRN